MDAKELNAAVKEFVTSCRVIAWTVGKTDRLAAFKAAAIWQLEASGALVYSDEVVEIVSEAKPSLRMVTVRKENLKPILCTTVEGAPHHWHPELLQIRDHVRRIAEALNVVTS